jgi:hypothetical protein
MSPYLRKDSRKWRFSRGFRASPQCERDRPQQTSGPILPGFYTNPDARLGNVLLSAEAEAAQSAHERSTSQCPPYKATTAELRKEARPPVEGFK